METFLSAEHVRDDRSGRVNTEALPLIWEQEIRPRKTLVLQAFAGFEPLLIEWLLREGYDPKLSGFRPGLLGPHNAERIAEVLTQLDAGFIDFVRQQERGCIRYDSVGVSAAKLIAQVALGWPKERLLVISTRQEDARRLHEELQMYLPRISLFAGRALRRAERVVIATPRHVASGAIGVERRTICICLNPAEMFSRDPVESIKHIHRARFYGLLPIGAGFPPYTRTLITALFGTSEVVVPRHGQVVRGVDVATMRIRGGPPVGGVRSEVGIRRAGIWQHPVRNRRIAKLSDLIANGKFATAHREFPQFEGVKFNRGSNRVVILAENVEHALALASSLPAAPIVHGPDCWIDDLSPEKKRLLNYRVPRVRHVKIATPDGLASIGPVDVLLRADSGRTLPALAADQRIAPPGTQERLLVIDCQDRHHPVLRSLSGERREAYVAAGWRIHGETESSPLDSFLATRPEVST